MESAGDKCFLEDAGGSLLFPAEKAGVIWAENIKTKIRRYFTDVLIQL